jgi:uncharacterized pyridoxal phosphate-dependent enzyme
MENMTPDRRPLYEELGIRTFINAMGTITTIGGSIMPNEVTDAMVEASRHFVMLGEFQEKAGERIAALTGAEAAFICAGAASGMLLAGAACLTGTDTSAVEALPETAGRPNEFVISLVDSHHYIHQGFRVCGGVVVPAGTESGVSAREYAEVMTEKTAALVFFLGSQSKEDLAGVIDVAHRAGIPVIVDAAAQLPPKSNLTDITAMGADLVCFSGGKGLCGPQSSGLVLETKELVRAIALNSSPNSAIGRGMKVGKEEIAGLLKAVELFMVMDEDVVIVAWEQRCQVIGEVARQRRGIRFEYDPPYTQKFPPAALIARLCFEAGPYSAERVNTELRSGVPAIMAGWNGDSISFGPQTLQEGEAEVIASRLLEILLPL